MKRYPFLVVLALIFVFFLADSSFAQDSGEPDTLYFSAGPPCSPDGDTLFFPEGGGFAKIYINVWNDDSITGISIPLVESAYGPPDFAFMDLAHNNHSAIPLCYSEGRISHWGTLNFDMTYYPPKLLYGAVTFGTPMPPGDGSIATMIYTANDTGRICLDTLIWGGCCVLTFARPPAIGYTPQVVSRCFQIAPYICCDANGDSIVNIVDIVWLINYLFKSGPGPENWCDANCDLNLDITDVVYLINYKFRSGPPPRDPDNDGEADC